MYQLSGNCPHHSKTEACLACMFENTAKRIEEGHTYSAFADNGWMAPLFQMSPVFVVACMTSMESVKKLHETMLPGWGWSTMYIPITGECSVNVWEDSVMVHDKLRYINHHSGNAKTIAAAWLAAIVRAKGASYDKG